MNQSIVSGTQKLRQKAGKILQKMKLSKGQDDTDLEPLIPTEGQDARFVTFTRSTEAPQIIDLKAMRKNIHPQPLRIDTHVARSQSELNRPELHLQGSFDKTRSPTETGTPLRRNPQQAFVYEMKAALDDIANYEGYELIENENEDEIQDWTLLDLPEHILRRLANDSNNSLICRT